MSISNEAVCAATGKTWKDWFALLDKSGAKDMAHRDIARLLASQHKLSGWWSQMVTVEYERVRGKRQMHEKCDGFSVTSSKTLAVPLARLYAAWIDSKSRQRWLEDPAFTVRKATRDKSMRITWVDGESQLDVQFLAKGPGKSQVAVEHGKLKDAKAAARWKPYWKEQLARLTARLEGK